MISLRNSRLIVLALLSAACVSPVARSMAGEEAQAEAKGRQAIAQGVAFLVASQREDGGWEAFGRTHPAITALVLKCLLEEPAYGTEHPVVRRGLAFLMRFVHPDGGIYVEGEGMRNYHTSVALMALSSAKEPAYKETIQKAQAFLQKLQWDEGEGYGPSATWYGGQGYGHSKRPDLSNTQMMLEALKQSGLPADDPAYKKALAFVSRCQMLSETNDQAFARGSDDGGFVYTPANDGESKAGTVVVEGKPRLRSYGSMTYAGFKSMLYAQVDRNDVRVQRAYEWIRRYYTLDQNPNMPLAQSKEGLYYFYHVFARALDAWGEEIIVDARGKPHRWREELCLKLAELQQPDGSWFNEEDRWYEGNPHLVTAYAVRALQTALDR
ncbi:MAG: terpene cyclase/mutase family protein [Phycisphaerales bacterium]|nr:MAG: terpene cyclase/mutase family protein [Phycisphaerales bacterium]